MWLTCSQEVCIFGDNEGIISSIKNAVGAHWNNDSKYPAYSTTEASILKLHIQKLEIHCMSHVVRKPAFCICENKDADQLRGNRTADQRLCFRYTDSTISLLPKYEISSHLL